MAKKKNKKASQKIDDSQSNNDFSSLFSIEGEYRHQCFFDGWHMIGGGLKIPTASCQEAKDLAKQYSLAKDSDNK
jgi:hypothetical protein